MRIFYVVMRNTIWTDQLYFCVHYNHTYGICRGHPYVDFAYDGERGLEEIHDGPTPWTRGTTVYGMHS